MRRTPLRPGTKRLRSNPERRSKLSLEQFGTDAYVAWIHRLPCSVPGCDARDVEQAHSVTRAAGGTWRDTLPLCREHHREQHVIGLLTFERRYGLSLVDMALETQRAWEER